MEELVEPVISTRLRPPVSSELVGRLVSTTCRNPRTDSWVAREGEESIWSFCLMDSSPTPLLTREARKGLAQLTSAGPSEVD